MSIEIQRKMAMDAIYATTTWKACWPVWEPEILFRTDNLSNPEKIFDLGSQLKAIFSLTNTGVRDQSSVTSAGTAWECLVCWYLNLVSSGTNAVATRRSATVVPGSLLDATTITYGNYQTNSESDICVIVYPDDFSFPIEGKSYLEELDAMVKKRWAEMRLGIVQCKTSWNENAQIPMLWDMVYRASFDSDTNISIGQNGYTVRQLKKRFTYSFVTLPSQKKPHKPGSMPVKRTKNLSGGNYWGMPSTKDVALSISEIFTKNFEPAFKPDVKSSIKKAIDLKIGLFA